MAQQKHAVPGFVPFAKDKTGSTKSYVNSDTGEIISRRQFVERAREIETGRRVSLEKTAEFNRQTEPEKAIIRPARGRKSAQKLPQEDQSLVAKLRAATDKQKKEKAKQVAEEKKLHDTIERKKNKKYQAPKKLSGALLRPGAMGRRIPFQGGYPEYLRLFEQGKQSKILTGYAIGLIGVDTRTGRELTPILFTLSLFDSPIPPDEFQETVASFLEEHSYFEFAAYYMHLAFRKDYAAEKAKKYGIKRKRKK